MYHHRTKTNHMSRILLIIGCILVLHCVVNLNVTLAATTSHASDHNNSMSTLYQHRDTDDPFMNSVKVASDDIFDGIILPRISYSQFSVTFTSLSVRTFNADDDKPRKLKITPLTYKFGTNGSTSNGITLPSCSIHRKNGNNIPDLNITIDFGDDPRNPVINLFLGTTSSPGITIEAGAVLVITCDDFPLHRPARPNTGRYNFQSRIISDGFFDENGIRDGTYSLPVGLCLEHEIQWANHRASLLITYTNPHANSYYADNDLSYDHPFLSLTLAITMGMMLDASMQCPGHTYYSTS